VTMPLPDFVIIGAMKCGTSSLHAQLAAQDGFLMSEPKEPNFFSDDDVFARGLDWYRSLFRGGEGVLKGESSTHYTKRPTYPACFERLSAALPEARFIYVMRDPLDRLVSHYIHEWTMGNVKGALTEEIETRRELIDYGRYAYQLEPYLDHYGKERILPVFFERMKADPQGELSRIGAFLGAERPLAWRDDISPQNVSKDRLRKIPMSGLLIDNAPARALRRALAPQGLRDWVKSRLQMRERPSLSEDDLKRVKPVFDEDLGALGAMLGVGLDCDAYRETVTGRSLDWAR